MKKLTIMLAIGMVFMFKLSYAAPFLVCDPDSLTTNYIIIMDGEEPVETPAPLHFDLADLKDGEHVVNVQGKNVWGVGVQVPFGFEKGLPLSPINMSLSPD